MHFQGFPKVWAPSSAQNNVLCFKIYILYVYIFYYFYIPPLALLILYRPLDVTKGVGKYTDLWFPIDTGSALRNGSFSCHLPLLKNGFSKLYAKQNVETTVDGIN